jgi:hypothetical protein
MARDWHFYDSAGSRRRVVEAFIYDSAGSRRRVKEGYFYDSAGTRRKFWPGLPPSFTVTPATLTNGEVGYVFGVGGSISPTSVRFPPYGASLYGAITDPQYAPARFQLTVDGLPSDPGVAGLFSNISASGVGSWSAASAVFYQWQSGNHQAYWQWSGATMMIAGTPCVVSFS